MGQFYILLVIFAVLAIQKVFGVISQQLRLRSLKEKVEQLGIEYQNRLANGHWRVLSRFPIIQQMTEGVASPAILAETERLTIALVDYEYRAGKGKEAAYQRQAFALLRSSLASAPSRMLQPRTLAQRLGLSSGGLTIDDQAFNNLFGIAGVSPDQVKKWLNSERSQALARHPNLRLYVEGSDALIVLPEKTLQSSKLEQHLKQALDVAQVVYGKLD
ncbi:MAG: hypothetical protein ACK523_17615 [Pirellulaceae bacterium]